MKSKLFLNHFDGELTANKIYLFLCRFSLPGGKFKYKDSEEEMELESISGKLKPYGTLTVALDEALEELQSGGGVHNPRKLFSALTKILPQFSGGDQHDSHELLRHLLESVKYVNEIV